MSITYEVIDENTVKRTDEDGNEIFIPADASNGFYQRYLRFVETGSEFAAS